MSQSRLPVVSGPVLGGKGHIFGSPIEDLSERGFVMEEYFLEGTAVSYAPTKGAELSVFPAPGGGAGWSAAKSEGEGCPWACRPLPLTG